MPYSHQLQNTARVVYMPQHLSLVHAPALHRYHTYMWCTDIYACTHTHKINKTFLKQQNKHISLMESHFGFVKPVLVSELWGRKYMRVSVLLAPFPEVYWNRILIFLRCRCLPSHPSQHSVALPPVHSHMAHGTNI